MNSKKIYSRDAEIRIRAHQCFNQSEFKKCIEHLHQILKMKADDYNLLGISLKSLQRNVEALKAFEQGSVQNPKHQILANNLSAQALAMNYSDLATLAARKALESKPDYPEAHYNLGNALMAQGDFQAAIESYDVATGLRPEYVKAWLNLGVAYQKTSQFDKAYANYQKALEIEPKSDTAHHNLANLCYEQGKLRQAVQHAMIAANLQPNSIKNISSLYHLMRSSCSWDQLKLVEASLDNLAKQCLSLKISGENPFIALYRTADMDYVCKTSANELKALNDIVPLKNNGRTSGRIVIGYLSRDFREHPVGQAIMKAFELHNRDKFKIVACSYGPKDQSAYCKVISDQADEYIDLCSISDKDAAIKIQQAGVDILVDLAGHTQNNRISIMAHRPAPVQCLYMGYPATSGASFIDYYIADKKVLPPSHVSRFSEKVVYLNSYYHLCDEYHPIGEVTSKEAQGLPDDTFVFSSFAARYKITPDWFGVWLEILKQCDNAILWLGAADEFSEANMINFAVREGVEAKRLKFAPKMPLKSDHLSRLRLADLAFDTPFFNGMTTTHDALMTGLPVLTVRGTSYSGMVGAALMEYLDLDELIAADSQDFINKAVNYYHNRDQLTNLKQRCSLVCKSPVLQAERVVRDLEKVYTDLIGSE